MLIPVLKALGITKSSSAVILKDNTGAYNSTTNPGGYGSPNSVSPPVAVGFRFRNLSEASPYYNAATNDSALITELLSSTGHRFDGTLLGLGIFKAGVHQMNYYPFETTDTIVSVATGSKTVIVTSGTIPTAFDAAYKAVLVLSSGGTIVSNVLMIDKSVAYTTSEFAITMPWLGTDMTGCQLKLATEADLKVLFTQLADGCLSGLIGALAMQRDCSEDDVNLAKRLSMWKLSAQIKFDCGNYAAADELIRAVYNECNSCANDSCKTCA